MKYKLVQFPNTIFDTKAQAVKFAYGLGYKPKEILKYLVLVNDNK